MSNDSSREFWIAPEEKDITTDSYLGCAVYTSFESIPNDMRGEAMKLIDAAALQKLQAQLDEADTALAEGCVDDCGIDLEKTSAEDLRDIIRAIDERARATLASLRKESK